MDQTGLKYDSEKPDWSLLPLKEIEKIVEIMTYGAKKYARDNWMYVEPNRYYAALLRHLAAWQSGEINDPESGKPHLSHVMCNVLFLSYLTSQNNETKE
jgi:hypothetical protein